MKASVGRIGCFWFWTILAVSSTAAQELEVGLLVEDRQAAPLAEEWLWALRGGGAKIPILEAATLDLSRPQLRLLVADAVPLRAAAAEALARWTAQGGLLIVAGADSSLQEVDAAGVSRKRRDFLLRDLLGVRFAGYDPGLRGTYPRFVISTPLLSPFLEGDALRLGEQGIGHEVRIQATDAQVLARSACLSPGPGGLVLESDPPTIVTRKAGEGRVLFLSFSPARVAACYPGPDGKPTDCTAAGSARALMRWLAANLLWEERRIPLPLPSEAPGDRPHAVLVTADVHDDAKQEEVRSARQMAALLGQLGLPASFFLVGRIATTSPQHLAALRQFRSAGLGPHSLEQQKYQPGEISGAETVSQDVRDIEQILELQSFPEARQWLISMRTEGWGSNESQAGAWHGLWKAGIGLVFDHSADAFQPGSAATTPLAWHQGDVRQRIFVPVAERSVATNADQFRLGPELQRDIASLASAQPDPCCNLLVTYRDYTPYVKQWHELFSRLAPMGGLIEVWLWHPSTPAWKGGFDDMREVLEAMRQEPALRFVRGDDLATWRANRERCEVQAIRGEDGQIRHLELLPPRSPLFPLPPDAHPELRTVTYWVLGSAEIQGWTRRIWADPAGRAVTLLIKELPEASP